MTATQFTPVPWCYRTNIYEVNLRQYTTEGTFEAFGKHLLRLQAMGVETLWFMPITPIGIPERLGSLGSYYACSSYVKTNPEYGSIQDFKNLVQMAHSLRMKVIIDWVANHTGYGHEWMEGRKRDYYDLSPSGNFQERNGWKDVADLDYGNKDMRREMIESMQFWIKEANIDGFRCDMAHLVPLDFWQQAREQCDAIKPMFWLAETEDLSYHQVFDASYAWQWMHATEAFFAQQQTVTPLFQLLSRYASQYPVPSWKLFFTTNHDENSWNGTEFEKFGDASWPLFVFSSTYDGLPLMYSGQELPNQKRLAFFEKDPIAWTDELAAAPFFTALYQMRKTNAAAGGPNGSITTQWLQANQESAIGFYRQQGEHQLLVLLNLGKYPVCFYHHPAAIGQPLTEIFTQHKMIWNEEACLQLPPWGYAVYSS